MGRRGHWLFDLEYQSWEQIIRRATSKPASLNPRFGLPNLPMVLSLYLRVPFERMNLHFGMTNTVKTCTRCLKRMPGFAGFWLTSSSINAFTQHNAVAVHGRTVPSLGGRMRRDLADARIFYTNPIWAAGETRGSEP